MAQITEVSGYDLSSTGEIARIAADTGPDVGWQIHGTAAADYDVEIEGVDVGPWAVDSYTGVTDVDDGRTMPEANIVVIKNTSTASGTADVLLGVSEQ